MAFGAITKREFHEEGKTLDQWRAEMSFRKACAMLAAELRREARIKQREMQRSANGER